MAQSPTEVCTVARAQELGIYKGPEQPYNPTSSGDTYDDLRTYNNSTDNQQNRTKSLCKDSLDGTTSSRNCVDEYGPGFVRKLGSLDGSSGSVCSAYDCPPGFTKQGNDCKKPLADAEIDKRARCDERWYDWFVTPNYHLGNGVYSSNVGQCYAPCPEYQIPSYVIDPVDESTLDFVSTEDLSKCVPRDKYFYGKYKIGSDYCPLAWIHRLNATKTSLSKQMNSTYAAFNSSNMTTGAFSQYVNNPTAIQQSATQLMSECSAYYDNITTPTDTMQNACNALNTHERVSEAYNWCAELYDNEEEYRRRIIHESGDSVHIDRKIGMMKQACNAVFCNDNDTAMGFVNKNEICFPPPPQIDPSTGKVITEDDLPLPEPPNTNSAQSFVKKTLRQAIYIVIIPAVLLILWFVYSRFIYPRLIDPIWLAIRRLLGEDKDMQTIIRTTFKRILAEQEEVIRKRLAQA